MTTYAVEDFAAINRAWRENVHREGGFVCCACRDTGRDEAGRECRGCRADYSLPGKPLR